MHASRPHVMIDLETLDTARTAKILSIGAVRFDPHGEACLGPPFYGIIDEASYADDPDFTESAATRAWWDRQSEAARAEVMGNPRGRPWREVLEEFRAWYAGPAPPVEVWANSPSFDCAILEYACEVAGQKVPWHYHAKRDVRTLGALVGTPYHRWRQTLRVPAGTTVMHCALDDCQDQIAFVHWALRTLGCSGDEVSDACVLYTGPMYAGKTDALIAHLRLHVASHRAPPLVVKHAHDRVRHGATLASRSGATWDGPVAVLETLDALFEPPLLDQLGRCSLLALDEAQFFEPAQLAAVVRRCTEAGTPVVLSALSAVADATPWPAVAAVQPFVSRTVHLRAICAACRRPGTATLTHRRCAPTTPAPDHGGIPPAPVLVRPLDEEETLYRPLCPGCYGAAQRSTPGGAR